MTLTSLVDSMSDCYLRIVRFLVVDDDARCVVDDVGFDAMNEDYSLDLRALLDLAPNLRKSILAKEETMQFLDAVWGHWMVREENR